MSAHDTTNNEQDLPKRRKKERPPKKRGFLARFFIFFASFLLLAVAVAAVGGAVLVYNLSKDLPSDDEILSYRANESSAVYDRNGKLITTLFIEDRQPVKLKDVSRAMVMSILAAEDSDFYSHKGIRPLAIFRSLATGEKGQGASTITQQLARNLFLSSEKTMTRKIKEAILTLRMERLFTKDSLLETYLNAIYFGHGAWGIASAARMYFDTTADKLTLSQASVLAGLVAAPERYSPFKSLERSKVRQGYVLGRLVQLGWVTPEEADAAKKEPLKLSSVHEKSAEQHYEAAPYFVTHILFSQLLPTYGTDQVYKSGMRIFTTLDLDLQRAAEAAMAKLKPEGALVALDPRTGEVLAMVGGKDFSKTKFNRATQAFRPCGSAFKAFVYTAALQAGFRPNDHILDEPITISLPHQYPRVWTPHNFSREYAGEETLFNALAHSHNTPAVRLTCLVGANSVVDLARSLGITSPHLIPTLSVGLGVSAVTPLEMAEAFGTLGNKGVRATPYFVSQIRANDGKLIYSATPKTTQAISPQLADMARSLLETVMLFGTAGGGRVPGWASFGKTGTTNDYSDAWFCGGLPNLVCVVYAGNDNYTSLGRRATGGHVALPIWKAFMTEAAKILNLPKSFGPAASGLKLARLSRSTGFLAGDGAAVTLLMDANEIPSSRGPADGDLLSSSTDPNAPRLLLLPQDQELLTSLPQMPQQPIVTADEKTIEQTEALPVTVDKPKVETPKSIDERYEELLRQYGIKH